MDILQELSLGEYSAIRQEYWARIFDAVFTYLTTSQNINAVKLPMRAAIGTAYPATADMAWIDGGGELPLDEDALSVASAAESAELGYVEELANNLRMLKKDESFNSNEAAAVAERHAEGYARSLDRLYNSIKVLAAGSKMLTFVGDDGTESCTDCQKYKGKRHKAKWWVANDAVPPNRNFECGGWQCLHVLADDSGRVYTL